MASGEVGGRVLEGGCYRLPGEACYGLESPFFWIKKGTEKTTAEKPRVDVGFCFAVINKHLTKPKDVIPDPDPESP